MEGMEQGTGGGLIENDASGLHMYGVSFAVFASAGRCCGRSNKRSQIDDTPVRKASAQTLDDYNGTIETDFILRSGKS